MNILAVIPARLASTRLARKPLRDIAGRPMLAWVYEAARASKLLNEVTVATDSDEIELFCRKSGYNVRMTSPDCNSGTERVVEVSRAIPADVYINVQGDE